MDAKDYISQQKDLLDRVEDLEGQVSGISTLISRLGIDTQQYVKANDPIPPGMACKVAFNQYGLIQKGYGLDVSDIPELPIEKITNLREALNKKADTSNSKRELPTRAPKKGIAGTGIKINYDEDGRVVSASDLLPTDIPDLPLEKIEGLLERLKSIEDLCNVQDDTPEFRVSPGTGVKITYDSSGRVVKGEKLSLNDIPHEMISRLNIIESKMSEFAPHTAITSLQESIMKKLDANGYMTPGTYMKVRVDSKGLVTGYEKVTKKDLPPVEISDIEGLDKSLRDKADRASVIELHETVASLSSLHNKLSEISSIKVEVSKKADREEVSAIKDKISSVDKLLEILVDRIPNDTILEFLTQVQKDITDISGRISVLEKKFSEE